MGLLGCEVAPSSKLPQSYCTIEIELLNLLKTIRINRTAMNPQDMIRVNSCATRFGTEQLEYSTMERYGCDPANGAQPAYCSRTRFLRAAVA